MEQAFTDSEAGVNTLVNERLVDFLYLLVRDNLPAGVVEEQVQKLEDAVDEGKINVNEPSIFSNRGLEQYAREIEERLRELSSGV